MSCEAYNLVKEGDLRNRLEDGITLLDTEAIRALYNGDIVSTVTTLSGIPATAALIVEFGEAYDICYVDYYTDEVNIDNIEINYGTTSTVSGSAPLVLTTSGIYRGTVDYHASFIEVRHTVSGTAANIKQLEVIGTKNETLGFKDSSGEEVDHLYMPHATVGTLSASPTVIDIFNDNHFDEVAHIAVAPTNTDADNYIHIATSAIGPYYGIDDYGFRQPGANHIPLHDDAFSSISIDSQWEVRGSYAKHAVVPTPEGLYFDIDISGGYETATMETGGLISKEFFTATSFTVEVDIKILGIYQPNTNFWRRLYMVLTNSFPIPDVGYSRAYGTDERRGASVGGLMVSSPGPNDDMVVEDMYNQFRWVDGNASDDPVVSANEYQWMATGNWGGLYGEMGTVGDYTFAEFEDILYEGNTMGDITEAALWHSWRLVYDHQKQELSGYVDNIFIGSRIFRVEAFKEGCKLFIGCSGLCGFRWVLRNFRIHQNKIYRQKNVALIVNGGTMSATISGTEVNTSAAIDGDTSTCYVGPDPDMITHVRVDFDQPYDIAYYKLKQRSQTTSVSAFGKTYYPDMARTSLVDFGGRGAHTHRYPNLTKYYPRSPTYSGTAVVASGISYVDIQFVDYDETTQTNGALVIEELEVIAEETVDVFPLEPESSREVPWAEGRWFNLRQYGTGNFLALKDKGYRSVEAGFWPVPEYFQSFVDYGFSSAVNGRQYADPVNDYHHSESLFSSPGSTSAGDYCQWHSDNQYDNNIYLWRYFTEMSRVKAIYWNSGTLRPSNIAHKFKFQYLSEEGDPNNNDDWVDIVPVSQPHLYTDTDANLVYKDYKDYLIANNDGEFYTDYASIPAIVYGNLGYFDIGGSVANAPSGLIVPTTFVAHYVWLNDSGSPFEANGLAGYVEFDEEVLTRGIRFVVYTAVTYDVEAANKFALEKFKIFRVNGSGSYLSPVFDTGTRQNTERLKAAVRSSVGSSSAVYVRSHNEPPTLAYDPHYETWRSTGAFGKGDVVILESLQVQDTALNIGNNTYFMMSNVPYVYNHPTDTWSILGGGYPGEGKGSSSGFNEDDSIGSVLSPALLPDNRVRSHSALLDDGNIYSVAYTAGEVRRQQVMKYLFSGTPAGWSEIGGLRPTESEYAVMVSYGRRLYFFNDNGAISYYNVDEDKWVVLGITLPTYGGTREGCVACVWGDKVFVFGCSSVASQVTDIFDFNTETLTNGAPIPFPFLGGQAVLDPEKRVIYLFPSNLYKNCTTMKYFPDEDRWEIPESLMWWRDVGGNNKGRAMLPYYREGYIYCFLDNRTGARTKVRREPWLHGKQPDFRDSVWKGIDIPWRKLDSLGELMPQERYFQFRVELYSDDREHTPTLESVNIVTPQDIIVPASGTAEAFVKIGVSPNEVYQAWYGGNGSGENYWNEEDFSIIYVNSDDGITWESPTVASGTWYAGGLVQHTTQSPWVIKEGTSSYKYWFTRGVISAYAHSKSICYALTSSSTDLAGEVIAIAEGAIAQTESGAYYPCVVKRSSTDYRMWYTGMDSGDTQRIFYATSSGGGTWVNLQLTLDIDNDAVNGYDQKQVYRPSVIEEGGVFRMWYTGTGSDDKDRILYTVSTDGVSWETPRLVLDLNSESGGLDRFGASMPMVLLDSSVYIMYYIGYDGTNNYVLRTTSPDGLEWFDSTIVFPAFGIESEYDVGGILDMFVLVNNGTIVPGEVITTGKIKIHNEGAAL